MSYVVLGAWLVQSGVGIGLLVSWLRHGHRSAPKVVLHVGIGLAALALWIVFIVADNLIAACLTFILITVANAIGDLMLVARSRRIHGTTSKFWPDYWRAAGATFRGAMPKRVTFHALFSPVVYFLCLAVCIGAYVA